MEKKIFEKKLEELNSSNSEKLENIIRELGGSKDKRAIPILIDMLSKEKDINIRNALALSLGELKADEALPLLMGLIRDPENENKRGSFVYALKNLECKEYFLDFVEMICNGNYEVSYHAFEIFELIVDDVSFNEKLEAKKIIEKQKHIELRKLPGKYPQYDRIHFLNDALRILED